MLKLNKQAVYDILTIYFLYERLICALRYIINEINQMFVAASVARIREILFSMTLLVYFIGPAESDRCSALC